jgi:hypothetical protein
MATAEFSLFSVDVQPTENSLITVIFQTPVRAGAGLLACGLARPSSLSNGAA